MRSAVDYSLQSFDPDGSLAVQKFRERARGERDRR
jgi:hypothetical protein